MGNDTCDFSMEGDGVIGGGGECTPEVTELGDMGSAGFEWSFCGKGGKGGGPSPRAPKERNISLEVGINGGGGGGRDCCP